MSKKSKSESVVRKGVWRVTPLWHSSTQCIPTEWGIPVRNVSDTAIRGRPAVVFDRACTIDTARHLNRALTQESLKNAPRSSPQRRVPKPKRVTPKHRPQILDQPHPIGDATQSSGEKRRPSHQTARRLVPARQFRASRRLNPARQFRPKRQFTGWQASRQFRSDLLSGRAGH